MRLVENNYGLSWQIVPTVLSRLLQDKDTTKPGRVMSAVLQRKKLDIKAVKQAY